MTFTLKETSLKKVHQHSHLKIFTFFDNHYLQAYIEVVERFCRAHKVARNEKFVLVTSERDWNPEFFNNFDTRYFRSGRAHLRNLELSRLRASHVSPKFFRELSKLDDDGRMTI